VSWTSAPWGVVESILRYFLSSWAGFEGGGTKGELVESGVESGVENSPWDVKTTSVVRLIAGPCITVQSHKNTRIDLIRGGIRLHAVGDQVVEAGTSLTHLKDKATKLLVCSRLLIVGVQSALERLTLDRFDPQNVSPLD
jgi:hypothetical protein